MNAPLLFSEITVKPNAVLCTRRVLVLTGLLFDNQRRQDSDARSRLRFRPLNWNGFLQKANLKNNLCAKGTEFNVALK